METQSTWLENPSSFAMGCRDGLPVALGYFPAAITFGFLGETTGLTMIETLLMSIFVFAGAAQYMALNLLAIGTGAFEIIFTTFIVNIRHLLMSASLSERAENDSRLMKGLYAFGLTDEVFAVTSTKEGSVSTSYIFGVFLTSYSSWVIHSGIGHVAGSWIPAFLQQSLTFALYALFIALLAPSLKKGRKIVFLAASAAMLNSLFSTFLADGWAIIFSTLIAATVMEWVFPYSASKQSRYEKDVTEHDI